MILSTLSSKRVEVKTKVENTINPKVNLFVISLLVVGKTYTIHKVLPLLFLVA